MLAFHLNSERYLNYLEILIYFFFQSFCSLGRKFPSDRVNTTIRASSCVCDYYGPAPQVVKVSEQGFRQHRADASQSPTEPRAASGTCSVLTPPVPMGSSAPPARTGSWGP